MLNVKHGKRGGFGSNLITSEHEEWRKHRRIAGPSFSEKNIRLVWESSIEVTLGYFNKWNRDGMGRVVKVDNGMELTTQIALMVFIIAGTSVECAPPLSLITLLTRHLVGFGMSADWDADQGTLAPGHSMSFMEALKVSTGALLLRAAVPRWFLPLSQRGRRARRGFMEMEVSNSAWQPINPHYLTQS